MQKSLNKILQKYPQQKIKNTAKVQFESYIQTLKQELYSYKLQASHVEEIRIKWAQTWTVRNYPCLLVEDANNHLIRELKKNWCNWIY